MDGGGEGSGEKDVEVEGLTCGGRTVTVAIIL